MVDSEASGREPEALAAAVGGAGGVARTAARLPLRDSPPMLEEAVVLVVVPT